MSMDYPSFCQQVKERYEKLLNPKTFWIHFDHDEEKFHFKIPTAENLGYVLALLNCHDKESVQNAFERLKRIFCFYVYDVGFPEFLHDFPEVKSFSEQLFIYLILKRIKSFYYKFMKEDLQIKIDQILDNLEKIFDRALPNKTLKSKYQAFKEEIYCVEEFSLKDFGDYLFIREPKEDSFLSFDPWTLTVSQKWGLQKRVGNAEEMTSFHLIALFCLKLFDEKLIPNSLIRYLPLLESKWCNCSYQQNLSNHSNVQLGNGLQINFPKNYSIGIFSNHRIEVKNNDSGFIVTTFYPDEALDEKESLVEMQVFCSNSKEFNLLADQKKVTTFPLTDEVQIIDSKDTQIAKISFEAQGGVFLGTISFGNRPTQKLKTFTPYDKIIGIRTVTRKENARLTMNFEYDKTWKCID